MILLKPSKLNAPITCDYGPYGAGILTFLFEVPWYMPSTAGGGGDICMDQAQPKALPKSQQVNMKLSLPVGAWNQNPWFHSYAGMMLRSQHGI